jgi:hypothetical protein
MVLVEDHAVETQFFTIGHLLQMFGIVRGAFGRIEKAAGNRGARCFFGNMRIGEQIEVIEFHEMIAP